MMKKKTVDYYKVIKGKDIIIPTPPEFGGR